MSKELTGYPSIDKPQNAGASFFERHPIIPNINLYMLLKITILKNKNAPAVDCGNLKATYSQLLHDAVTVSVALKTLGLKKGEVAAISMPNLYQALVVFFACNRIGVITTFLDSQASADETLFYLNSFKCPILFNYDKTAAYNQELANKSKVRCIVTLERGFVDMVGFPSAASATGGKYIGYESLGTISKQKKNKFEWMHGKKEDALILFTSGSTGKPKAVLLTNENVLAAEIYVQNTATQMGDIKGTKTLTCVPFSYPYGFVTSALTSLFWGKETILAPDIGKDTVSQYYSKKPNIIFGSPALLELTINNIPAGQDLSSVTHFISGGDFLTVQHAQRGNRFFEKHGAPHVEIGNGYGNAETVSVGANPVGVPLRPETAGKVLVGASFMIVNPDTMEELSYGKEGLLLVSGKHVFKEYYKNPKLTKEVKITINGREYYNTGTMGFIDADGYFTVTGRQSRFYIMSSLNKVYCDNVQNIIAAYDKVLDCAVVKVPDADLLFVNKAYIVLDTGIEPNVETEREIRAMLTCSVLSPSGQTVQLKPYEMPTYIEFVTSLPRKPGTDKINYQLLEQDAAQKHAGNVKLNPM